MAETTLEVASKRGESELAQRALIATIAAFVPGAGHAVLGQLGHAAALLGGFLVGCTLAVWHHPLFSSGPNGGTAQMRDVWRLLYKHGVEIVLSGHNHMYERFAPQDAEQERPQRGLE